jgi:hypothetical protein
LCGLVEMIEVSGCIFLGIDQKRHKCTLEDDHDGRCHCGECQVGEKDRGFSYRYRSKTSRRAHVPEEQVIQNWIEQHERRRCPYCLRSLPYDAKYCDGCGKLVNK